MSVDALIRLVGAVLNEQHDEWIGGRRCLDLQILARAHIAADHDPATALEEVPTKDVPTLNA